MTRHEYHELQEVLEQLTANNRRATLTIQALLDVLHDVGRQLEAEDDANTSREQQEARNGGNRRPL